MPARDRRAWLPGAGFVLAVLVAVIVFATQLVAGRPILGPLTLLVLAIPGVALAVALGAPRRSWPERLLAGVSLVLAVSVLAGIVAALSPRGLDAATLAAVELVVLAAAAVTWLWRRPRNRRASIGGGAHLRASARRRAVPGGGGSVAIVVLGVLLGAAGFAIATRSAQAQDVAEVLQFWSIPGPSGHTEVGVDDRSTMAVTCAVTITRPSQSPAGFQVGSLAPGQQWLGDLPAADPTETVPWSLALACTASDGQQLQRTLTIDPPR